MERFAKVVNKFYLLTIFAKCSILDVWQGSGYASTVGADYKLLMSVDFGKTWYLLRNNPKNES